MKVQAALVFAAATVAASYNTRRIVVDASKESGRLKNLQGTNSADSAYIPDGPWKQDTIHNKEPEIGALFPEYGIKHVLIYTFPDVFLGFGKDGTDADPLLNDNYNWTGADDYVSYVTSNGAKASIQFQPTNGTNDTVSSPEILGNIGFMITDRYMNGAYDSGFSDALELFEYEPETDLLRSSSTEEEYSRQFAYFSGFSQGIFNASSKIGISAWGGNQFYPVNTNYSVYDPYVSRFYSDCYEHGVNITAASFHFTNTQFSLDPYDIKRIVDKFRSEILVPAGLPDLAIWATEYELLPFPILPTSESALAAFNDPAFFASYTIAVSMYAQDTRIEQTMSWPGFGYNGTGAGDQSFPGFFNRSSSGDPVPLNAAKAFKLQAKLVLETPRRIYLQGNSSDGFAALAGLADNSSKVQILLNNYQLDYDIPREVTSQMVSLFNTSTTAYPILQDNGLMNGEATCFLSGACLTFAQATERNNTSTAYHIQLNNLPWQETDKYEIEVRRVADNVTESVFLTQQGQGTTMELSLPFPPNAQDLVSVQLLTST